MRWLDGITNLMDVNLNKLWEMAKDRGAWCAAVHEVTKSEQQQNKNRKPWGCSHLQRWPTLWSVFLFKSTS